MGSLFAYVTSENIPYEKVGDEVRSLENEVPFEIPESWEWVRLGSLMSIISDGTHKTPNYVEAGVPFLSVQNISHGYFDLSKIKYITQEEHNKLCERVSPQKEDILFCRIGTLGKAIKCTLDIEFSIFVSLGLLRPVNPIISDYIVFAINSPVGDRWIHNNKVGGGTHTYKINLMDIPNMLIPLPPIQEQKRIFEKMQELSPFLHEYKTADMRLQTLNSSFPDMLKKSILQMAVQGKLVPQDDSDEPASVLLERIRTEKQRLVKEGKIKRDKTESVIFRRDNSHYEKLGEIERCIDDEIPFKIPDSWQWCRLSSVISLLSGQDFEPSGYNSDKNGIPYITGASNIDNGKIIINRWTVTPRNIAEKGQLLIVCKGAGVGKMAILQEEKVHIARQVMSVNAIRIMPIYIQLFLQFNISNIRKSMQGVIPGISRDDILNLLIPIPPISEQVRIIDRLDELPPVLNVL